MLNADRDKLIEAVKFVANDQRNGASSSDTDRGLIDYARSVLHVQGDEVGNPNREVAPDDDDPEAYEAYVAVLRATKDELDYVFLSMV